MVRRESNSRPPAWQHVAQPAEPSVRGSWKSTLIIVWCNKFNKFNSFSQVNSIFRKVAEPYRGVTFKLFSLWGNQWMWKLELKWFQMRFNSNGMLSVLHILQSRSGNHVYQLIKMKLSRSWSQVSSLIKKHILLFLDPLKASVLPPTQIKSLA